VREAVFGKFLASWAFIGFNLLCTFPLVLTVAYLGGPDYLVILMGYLGSFLLGGAYLAIGCFFSALTKNQVISFILSVVFCYLFTMAGSPPILEFLSTFFHRYFLDLFESLSMINHFEAMGRGVVRLGDIWFFAVIILGWLYGCESILDEKKAS
jgi:ABC-2 type transport system permease protein